MTHPSPTGFRLGVVTGLQFEADIVRRSMRDIPGDALNTLAVACHGPGPARAGEAAQALIDDGATALLSFGVAGGCDPALPPGAAIVATAVRDLRHGGETLFTNRDWQRRLKALLLGNVLLETAQIASSADPLTQAAQKRALYDDLGVGAVDMESAAIARAAVAAPVPFIALRVVLDPHDLSLPVAAVNGLRPDGSTAVAAVTGSVLQRPSDIPALVRLAWHDRAARRTLKAAAAAAAPLFGAV